MPLRKTLGLYRKTLTDSVAIRRYVGVGPGRTHTDVACRGKLMPQGQGSVLVGNVTQQTRDAVLLIEDLVAGGFAMPVNTADKFVSESREYSISSVGVRRDEGVAVAYELTVTG